MRTVGIIQNWAAESAGTIVSYLEENDFPCKVVRTYNEEPLPETGEFGAVIVLGYPHSINDNSHRDFHTRLFGYIAGLVRSDVPLLGICYGAQMLAKVLGARVTQNKVREIGHYTVRLTEAGQTDRLFAGFDKEFEVSHWHNDTFEIPWGAAHLAAGEECRNQAFRKNNAAGVQFHLEPRPDEIPLWCDEYQPELAAENKTKDEVVAAFNRRAEDIKRFNYRLIENFLS